MFGSLLSSVIKVATLPLDVAEIAADVVIGGNGDRRTISEVSPTVLPSDMRDSVADAAKEIDK